MLKPKMIVHAIGDSSSEPSALLSATGSRAKIVVRLVIKMGLSLNEADSVMIVLNETSFASRLL